MTQVIGAETKTWALVGSNHEPDFPTRWTFQHVAGFIHLELVRHQSTSTSASQFIKVLPLHEMVLFLGP